jgi:hypothetical protein
MASRKKAKVEKQEAPARSRYENYSMREVRRDQLKNAPYNPRLIDPKNRARLQDNIRRVGLVSPIVWNERTGNIVSGHQRISIIDSLEKRSDYMLTVAVVDMDDATERAQNVMMNNTQAMGDFDVEKLEELFKAADFDLTLAGFDLADKFRILGDDNMATEDLQEAAEKIRDMGKIYDKIAEKNHARDHDDFFLVVVFKDGASRRDFARRLGIEDGRYVDAREIMARIPEFAEASGE